MGANGLSLQSYTEEQNERLHNGRAWLLAHHCQPFKSCTTDFGELETVLNSIYSFVNQFLIQLCKINLSFPAFIIVIKS